MKFIKDQVSFVNEGKFMTVMPQMVMKVRILIANSLEIGKSKKNPGSHDLFKNIEGLILDHVLSGDGSVLRIYLPS